MKGKVKKSKQSVSSCSPPCPCPFTSSSQWEDLPCLIFSLISVQAREYHHPCQRGFVELTFAIQQDICLTGANSNCLIHLPLPATFKTTQSGHCEVHFLPSMFQYVFPKGVVFMLFPEALLVFQPSGIAIESSFPFITHYSVQCLAHITLDPVGSIVLFAFSRLATFAHQAIISS